ncbi:unnamed protein product [Rotaria sp. Silwood2]|nr:unnamed protein product [Rotaria sp. Silwood2]CAF2566005.1 unnamed protein product [Rotaria sp. Silwood2]CAF2755757.1 unnamed protein product [Rotaria sp. Silwood2]CAF2915461.1 unnamed protein product [Rotaria sp. Silwood2]CAF3906420.1 unnamed protein product [Rotaria sp. Silwood2]
MYAPRAKFERIHVTSPIKVAAIFLTCIHCLGLFIAFLTSFWIKTNDGHYGPLFSCEKESDLNNNLILSIKTECHLNGFGHDIILFSMPLTAILVILSIFIGFISIFTGSLSFVKNSFLIRRRYWLCTIVLLLFVCIIDWFILIFIPLNYHQQIYHLQWAYGVHCTATIFISLSLITAILMHNTDDTQYIEGIDESTVEK